VIRSSKITTTFYDYQTEYLSLADINKRA